MIKNLKLAFLNIHMNIKNAKELKISFIISILGMILNNISFLILWYYFGKSVGIINGWEPTDIFGLYGISGASYGIIMAFFAGIIQIPTYISSGIFDKYLTSPKSILMKVSTSKVSTSAIGDLIYGIICFTIFAIIQKLSIFKILLSLYLVILSSIIFYSFFLVAMSISFYLMDGENVSSGLTNIFVSNSLYHGGAFTGILRFVFIFIIPSLLLGTIPVEIIKTLSLSKFITITICTIIWLYFSIKFFYKSLKKYNSNSLFGFGN